MKPAFNILQRSDLQQLQDLTKGGGRLEQLQLTPMQLAEMVQDCAVTLDGDEAAAVASLLAAAAGSSGSSRRRLLGGMLAAAREEVPDALAVCGLWPELGLMKQSCAANVTVTCLGALDTAEEGAEVEGAVLVLRAAHDMPAGTEVRDSFTTYC
jgi:hypothetical protein